jgi:hypothetical protein
MKASENGAEATAVQTLREVREFWSGAERLDCARFTAAIASVEQGVLFT